MIVQGFNISRFLTIVLLSLLLDKLLITYGFNELGLQFQSKYATYIPWSFLLSLLLICIIALYKTNNSVIITTPIVITMFFMTTFEYAFVKVIDQSNSESIIQKGYSLYNQYSRNIYTEEEENNYDIFKFCNSTGKESNKYIKNLNQSNFSFIFGLLIMVVGFHIFQLFEFNTKTNVLIFYNTLVSILSILLLFLFYYVNISSKYPTEPELSFKQILSDDSDNFTIQSGFEFDQYEPIELIRDKATIEYCAKLCNDADNCTGFDYKSEKNEQNSPENFGKCRFSINKEPKLTEYIGHDSIWGTTPYNGGPWFNHFTAIKNE